MGRSYRYATEIADFFWGKAVQFQLVAHMSEMGYL